MTALYPRRLRAQRNRTTFAARPYAIVAMFALAACGGRDSAASGESVSSASVEGPDLQAKTSRGHVQLTGDATVDTDFAVEQCSIGPAGSGPLNGYHMSAKAGRSTLQLLTIAVKDYDHDGSFTPAVDTGNTATKGKKGIAGPLTMIIGRENSTVPLSVITQPSSHLTITISDSGSRGTAEFSELTSPMAMEDIEIRRHPHAKEKTFAGSLSWRCASVERVDAAATDAAKGLLKGLTPVH